MTNQDRRRVLREKLITVDAKWRALMRDSDATDKSESMKKLRSQRLAITAELFELDAQDRRASYSRPTQNSSEASVSGE
jgi:hypothetical protein